MSRRTFAAAQAATSSAVASMNDAIVNGIVDAGADVSDAGQMNHRLDTRQQRRPIDRLAVVRNGNLLDTDGKRGGGGIARRGTHRRAGLGQRAHQRLADEAGGAGDEDAPAHGRARTKDSISHATSPIPIRRATMLLQAVLSTTLSAANATSPTLTKNIRPTICMLVKPLSRAR